MEVKGSAVDSLRRFVITRFREDGHERWLAALPQESRAIFNGLVLATVWYPAQPALFLPTKAVCDLFFDGDMRGAWEAGRYSAEAALSGVYRMVLRFASPDMVVEKSIPIITNYYRPMDASVRKVEPKHWALRMTGMDEPSRIIDNRVAGWCERCFELCKCKDVKSRVLRSATDARSSSEIHVSWS